MNTLWFPIIDFQSPSMRREWIEMYCTWIVNLTRQSPSMRREWIEMKVISIVEYFGLRSPSMRREWIEMPVPLWRPTKSHVSLHAEGVD